MLMYVYVLASALPLCMRILTMFLQSVLFFTQQQSPAQTVHQNSWSFLSRWAFSINTPHLTYTSVCVFVWSCLPQCRKCKTHVWERAWRQRSTQCASCVCVRTAELQDVAVQFAVVLLRHVEGQQCVVGLYRRGAERRPLVGRLNSMDPHTCHWGLGCHYTETCKDQMSIKIKDNLREKIISLNTVWCHFIIFWEMFLSHLRSYQLNRLRVWA